MLGSPFKYIIVDNEDGLNWENLTPDQCIVNEDVLNFGEPNVWSMYCHARDQFSEYDNYFYDYF